MKDRDRSSRGKVVPNVHDTYEEYYIISEGGLRSIGQKSLCATIFSAVASLCWSPLFSEFTSSEDMLVLTGSCLSMFLFAVFFTVFASVFLLSGFLQIVNIIKSNKMPNAKNS